jgi:hypothetical protein
MTDRELVASYIAHHRVSVREVIERAYAQREGVCSSHFVEKQYRIFRDEGKLYEVVRAFLFREGAAA